MLSKDISNTIRLGDLPDGRDYDKILSESSVSENVTMQNRSEFKKQHLRPEMAEAPESVARRFRRMHGNFRARIRRGWNWVNPFSHRGLQ